MTARESPYLLCDLADHVAWLTLNHPAKRNPLSIAMLEELRLAFEQIHRDQNLRVVVIRAAGSAFSAGHDLRELLNGDEFQRARIFSLCSDVMIQIRQLPQPVIASVQGVATAGGCQLVATCDLVIAAEEATFATPGVKIGLFCATPAVALSRAVASKKAMELLLTGREISAREAERIGLVNRVVPAEALERETRALAEQIAAVSPEIVALGKRAFYEQLTLDHADAYTMAQRVMVSNAGLPVAEEGMRAFLEKRPPQWN